MRVLIVGYGYVGNALGLALAAEGHTVVGIKRSQPEIAKSQGGKISLLAVDVSDPKTLPSLQEPFDWVVNALSSRGGGELGYRKVYFEGTQNLLNWLRSHPPKKYVHVSSTSVYGQMDGSLVTEQSPAEPTNATSQILIETEQLLLQAHTQFQWPSVVLRSAGIYGPDRGHLFLQYLRGEAHLTGDGDRWLNMIHRDDLVRTIQAALIHGTPGHIFNVSDDEPTTEVAFFDWLSQRLRRPLPPSIEPDAKSRKRGNTNKRVSNQKMKQLLDHPLIFPSFREGYESEIRRLGLG